MFFKKNAPSLEVLVNQCCEDYYSNVILPSSTVQKPLDIDVEPKSEEKYINYETFKDFILESHCQENLKFLIEIYHYEKIWNRIFKRQSSILKCKDESLEKSRKHSVATLFTNSSSFKRHPSIVELPEDEKIHEIINKSTLLHPYLVVSNLQDKDNEVNQNSAVHPEGNKAANNLIPELSIPTVIKSPVDFDTLSFVDEKGASEHTEIALSDTKPQQSGRSSKSSRKSSASNNEVWNNLFKPSYCDDRDRDCSCKDDVHNHDYVDLESNEYNEAVKQFEVREQLKEELSEKFNYILRNYVLTNSPFEINLPSEVYADLVAEYDNTQILYHSPLTLLPAKNAVLQLLRENIYYKYLSRQERAMTEEQSKLITKESKSHTSPSQPPPQPIAEVEQRQPQPQSRLIPILSNHSHDDCSTRSMISNEIPKSRSTTPITTISNLLNKYHIKVNSGSLSPSPAPSIERSTPPTEHTESKHHHKHPSKYMKGPCGIEPDSNAYDPKPPVEIHHSGWASKFSKFKLKKKVSQ